MPITDKPNLLVSSNRVFLELDSITVNFINKAIKVFIALTKTYCKNVLLPHFG